MSLRSIFLNPGKPIAVGPYSVTNYAMEAKKNQETALENAKEVILEVAKKFKEISGREYGLFEEYKTEDADYIMLIMGSAAGTAKEAAGKESRSIKTQSIPSVPGRGDSKSTQRL